MPSAEARSALTTVSPTPGAGPLRPEPPSVVPPNAAALAKSTSQTLTLGSALRVPPLPVVAAAWSPRTVSRPSTCGSPRRRSRRRAASSPWTIAGEATISSIGPRLSYAPCLTEKLSVSPTTRLPTMIAVPSTEPATTRVASPRRRATCRNASLRRNGRRTAMNAPTAAQTTSRPTSRGVRSGYTASLPGRLHHGALGAGFELAVADAPLVLDQPAVAHLDQPRHRGADAGVVGHQHDRLAVDVVQLVQQLHNLIGHVGVEVAGRLISPHDRGPGRQRPRDRDPLLLTPGQLVGPVAGAGAEPDPLQHLHRPPARLAGWGAAKQQRQLHVLGGGEDRDQVERLEDEAHRLGPVGRAGGVRHPEQVLAVEQHPAAVDVVQAGQAVQQRGLTGARGAHDGDHLAAADPKVQVDQRLHLDLTRPVDLADVLGKQQRLPVRRSRHDNPPSTSAQLSDQPAARPPMVASRMAGLKAEPTGWHRCTARPPRPTAFTAPLKTTDRRHGRAVRALLGALHGAEPLRCRASRRILGHCNSAAPTRWHHRRGRPRPLGPPR